MAKDEIARPDGTLLRVRRCFRDWLAVEAAKARIPMYKLLEELCSKGGGPIGVAPFKGKGSRRGQG